MATLLVIVPQQNNLWDRCFTTSTNLTPHLFVLGLLKLNLVLLLITWDWLKDINAGVTRDKCWCLSFFWLFQTWPVTLSSCFLVALCQTKPGSSVQEVSPSAGKNTRLVLVPCCTWKCVTTVISVGLDISEVLGCHLLWQMSSQ